MECGGTRFEIKTLAIQGIIVVLQLVPGSPLNLRSAVARCSVSDGSRGRCGEARKDYRRP